MTQARIVVRVSLKPRHEDHLMAVMTRIEPSSSGLDSYKLGFAKIVMPSGKPHPLVRIVVWMWYEFSEAPVLVDAMSIGVSPGDLPPIEASSASTIE